MLVDLLGLSKDLKPSLTEDGILFTTILNPFLSFQTVKEYQSNEEIVEILNKYFPGRHVNHKPNMIYPDTYTEWSVALFD